MGGIKNDIAKAFKSTQIFVLCCGYAFIKANPGSFDIVVGFGMSY